MDQALQGWCTDPFARHEARWMSQGKPTQLVKDGSVEGTDPVVEGEPFKVTPALLEPEPPAGASTLMRADGAQSQSYGGAKKGIAAAIEQVIAQGPFG